MTPRPQFGRRSLRGGLSALLATTVVAGTLAVATPVAGAAHRGAPSENCTFDGKAAPAPLTGIVPGKTTIAIVCKGTPGLGVAAIMASALGGIVIAPATATNEADIASVTGLKESPAGTYKATFPVPATFSAKDPNAVCPPSPGQFNAGIVGCAVAVINTATLSQFSGQETILETTAQTKPPHVPTLATSASSVTAGEQITFSDASKACPNNPTASSQCWWGDGLAASSTSAKPPTLTVRLNGKSVAGAVASVSGPGTGGRATYNGTTLVPQTLSGSLTVPSSLTNGTYTLTVTQTNVTPFDGNGKSPSKGSPISASATLVVGPFRGPVITALSASSGPTAGGTHVTITGMRFAGASAVHFGTSAAKFKVISSTSISTTSPAGSGTVDVTVTTKKGTSLPASADRFTYIAPPPPAVTSVNPASGTQVGGTLVTLRGTGFKGATAVHFGPTVATKFKVISDERIVATAPSGSGTVNVTVTTAIGTSPATPAESYAYLPGPATAPTVTAVSPAVGIGGTVVTLTGTGFSGATIVDFGSTAATKFTVESDTSIKATAPAGSVTGSAIDLTVTTPAGTSATNGGDQFTYVSGPVVSSVGPNEGSPLGGYSVTISGSGFTGARRVEFGSVSSRSFSVGGDSSITATVPAGTATVDVTVITPAGTSATSSADQFTYGGPVVSSVSPSAGSPLGGYSVSVAGTGFTGASAVDFGTTLATNVVVTSDDSLTATVPAGTGTPDVTVTTAAGTSATSPADQFDYVAVPTVSALSLTAGPTAGGNLVQITGTSLTGATVVDFGLTAASDITVISDTSLTAVVPPGTAGTVDVTVTVPSGTSLTSSADQYAYVDVPTVTGLSAPSGLSGGGDTVTITGTGFTTASTVDFGPGNGAGFVVNSDISITATTPSSPAGAGPVDVTVTNPGGTSVTSSADVFTYLALPTVTSVFPPAGPLAGGTQVVISGSGFTPSTTVEFGSTAGTGVDDISSGLLLATSPLGTAGPVDVTVTTTIGTSLTSGADQFTYEGDPTVISVSPAVGPVSGNVSVTITGTDFMTANQVDFGSQTAASFSITSPTTITAVAPSSVLPGIVDVTVVNDSATSATSVADEFTYVAAPTITAVSPPVGPVSGGTAVTITGTGFTGASAVTFGGVPATSFSVVSDTSISAVAPGQTTPAPFATSVQVTTAGGTAGDGSAGDTFNYTPVVPTITGVSPNQNTTAGDSLITVTGTGFTSDAAVNFGADGGSLSILGNTVTVNSSTSLTADSPAGAPGTVDITVSTSGGTSAITPADQFTYVTETATLTIIPPTGNNPGDTVTINGSGFPTGNFNITDSGVLLLQASPLATFLSGFSALADLDTNYLGEPTVDNNGNFSFQFPLANPFSASDPNAFCAPLQNQVDVGLVGCAIVGLNINAKVLLANLADVPIIYNGTQPDPPTLTVQSTRVHIGDTVRFSGSGWWGSYPGGGATAKICGLGGKPKRCDATTGTGVVAPVTYSGEGGSLHGATVSGSIKIASNLARCTSCFLVVTQPNLTPLPGTVTASLALTILPTVAAKAPVSSATARAGPIAFALGSWWRIGSLGQKARLRFG